MTKKANAQQEAVKWLTECGGEATLVDNGNFARAANNSFYYANRTFWKAIKDIELVDENTIRIKKNAV